MKIPRKAKLNANAARRRVGHRKDLHLLAVPLAVCLVSCAPDLQPEGGGRIDEAPVSTSQQPLWLANGITKWPNGSIPVCFDANVDNTLRSNIRFLVGESWTRAANLEFWNWSTCGASTAGWLRVFIDSSLAVLGTTNGFGYPGSSNTRTISFPNQTPSNKTIIHEFGHSLGFIHEHNDDGTCNQRTSGGTQLSSADVSVSIMSQSGCNGASQLSARDIIGVQVAYGEKPAGSIVGLAGQCLDVPPSSPAGTQVQYYRCNGGSNQKWRWESTFPMYLPALASSFLDVRGGSFFNGAVVQTYFQLAPTPPNQQWRLNSADVVAVGGTCVDIPGSNFANGQLLQIFGCNGGLNQKWIISPEGQIRDATFGIYCWDVPGGATATGTRIQIYSCNGGSNQRFTMTAAGQFQFGGKCVDVVDAEPNNGAQLQLYPCKSDSDSTRFNQKFHFRGPITTGSSFCLDIPGSNINDQVGAQIFTCNGGSNQTFDFYFGG